MPRPAKPRVTPEAPENQINLSSESVVPVVKKKELRCFNAALAGRTVNLSYPVGDEEVPVPVKIDETGLSEIVTIPEIYNQMLQIGFKAA